MRLLFFDFTIAFGGGPQGTAYLVKRLCSGNEVHVLDAYGCCGEYAEAIRKTGAEHHVLEHGAESTLIGHHGSPLARFLSLVRQLPELWEIRQRLACAVLEVDPDVIWVNNEKSLAFLASIPRLRRYPVVVYVRGWATPDQVGRRMGLLLRNRASAVLTHSRAALEQLRRAGIPEDRLHFVPNVVDRDALLERSKDILLSPAPTVLGHPRLLLPSARITPEKGHGTAIEAVSLLKKEGFEPSLWLPGSAAPGAGTAYVEKLKRLIAEAGLAGNVEFLGWRQDMPALIIAADIVVLPSHTEGLPRAILEAMILERPVCATPVGGIPEVIQNRRTGFLSNVGDPGGLAQNIRAILNEQGSRERVVAAAERFVAGYNDPEGHTRAVMKVFSMAEASAR